MMKKFSGAKVAIFGQWRKCTQVLPTFAARLREGKK
jgi:hypothetical protein